jgi:hypothetical protein
MDNVFPFGFPEPTAFYLTLQVLTFALHQAFMHYVLAGSMYVAWTYVFPATSDPPRNQQPLAAVLRDWMPFLLSAAITAGIAPLLFIQILYQREFYTSNLLLSWRWVIVVPVLILAFYLLYLLKSSLIARLPFAVRVFVVALTAASFVFVGFCWTANHLLGIAVSDWPQVYVTGDLPFSAQTVLPRMLIWIGGAFVTMPMFAGWQLAHQQKMYPEKRDAILLEGTRLARMALVGAALAIVASVTYLFTLEATMRETLFGKIALPYWGAAVVGLSLQIGGWIPHLRTTQLCRKRLSLVTAGSILSLVGVSVLRLRAKSAASEFFC